MPQIKDIKGQRFGSLVAVRFLRLGEFGRKYKCVKAVWEFQCDCGRTVEISCNDVSMGKRKTCGCRGVEDWRANFNGLYGQMKFSAKRRNLEWGLTKEQVLFLTKQNCFYCGRPPSNAHQEIIFRRGKYVYNGIDRMDNTKGYTIDNVVTCCERCNRKKLTDSFEDFRDWVIIVYHHWANNPESIPFELPVLQSETPAEDR